MVLALLRQFEPCRSSRVGRGHPVNPGDPLELFSIFHCAAGKPRTEARCKDALHGEAVNRHEQSLADVVPSEDFHKTP